MYIPFGKYRLHGLLEPVSRKVGATFTETEPIKFDNSSLCRCYIQQLNIEKTTTVINPKMQEMECHVP